MRTIGLISDHPPDQIPASHRDLTQCPPVAALTPGDLGDGPGCSAVDGGPGRLVTLAGGLASFGLRGADLPGGFGLGGGVLGGADVLAGCLQGFGEGPGPRLRLRRRGPGR